MAQSYSFKSHKSGDTFGGVSFTLAVTPARTLVGCTITMPVTIKLKDTIVKTFSTTTGELVIKDATHFDFKKQIVSLPKGSYSYKMVFRFANGDIKTYLTGFWSIY